MSDRYEFKPLRSLKTPGEITIEMRRMNSMPGALHLMACWRRQMRNLEKKRVRLEKENRSK